MEENIVIFGPAHVGKSTLGGYMHFKITDIDFKKFILDIKKNLGPDYDESQKFAYIADTAKDEREKKTKSRRGTVGTSIYMHTNRVRIGDHEVTIIDTPGAQHKYRERTKGMYFGEIGLFIIELSQLVTKNLLKFDNLSTLHGFFTPLIPWFKFRDKKRKLVIVISKMDQLNFSEEKFNEAIEMIRTICGAKSIEMIPIAIDVKGEKDHNVFTKSEKMPWYSGPTLIDKLSEICEEVSRAEIEEPLFISVEKRPFPISGIGKVWRGKILQGTLRKDRVIKITPIEYKKKKYISSLAKVRNIRVDKGEDIEIAKKGGIVGIDITDLRIEGKRVDRRDFNIVDTSYMTDPDIPLLGGNIIQFKIPLAETFYFLEPIMIFWFGKFVSSRVVNKMQFSDYGLITLELDSRLKASLPLHNNKFLFNNFLVKKDNEFIEGVLEKLGVPHTLTLSIKNINDKKDYLKEHFGDFKHEILTDKLRFYCGESLIDLIWEIKKFNERHIEEPEDVLSSINIEIKELKEA